MSTLELSLLLLLSFLGATALPNFNAITAHDKHDHQEWEYDQQVVNKLLEIMKLMQEKWDYKLNFNPTIKPNDNSHIKHSTQLRKETTQKPNWGNGEFVTESATSPERFTESTTSAGTYSMSPTEPSESNETSTYTETTTTEVVEPTQKITKIYTTELAEPTQDITKVHATELAEPTQDITEVYTTELVQPSTHPTEPVELNEPSKPIIEPEEPFKYTTEPIEPTDYTSTYSETSIPTTMERVTDGPNELSCPESWPFHDSWPIDARSCELDSECSEYQLCCLMFEEFYCVHAVVNTPKSGECPYMSELQERVATPQCLEDYPGCKFDTECPGSEKCCPSLCQYRSCATPAFSEEELQATEHEVKEPQPEIDEQGLNVREENTESPRNLIPKYGEESNSSISTLIGQESVPPSLVEATPPKELVPSLRNPNEPENNTESQREGSRNQTTTDLYEFTTYQATTLDLEEMASDLPPDSPMNVTSTEILSKTVRVSTPTTAGSTSLGGPSLSTADSHDSEPTPSENAATSSTPGAAKLLHEVTNSSSTR